MQQWEREIQEILTKDHESHRSRRWAANSLRIFASLAFIMAVGGYAVAPRLPQSGIQLATPVPTEQPFRAPRKPYYDYYRVAPAPFVASPSPRPAN